MSNAISKKIEHIFKLMKMLVNNNELYPQDINLQNELNVSERTLRRYLDDIHYLFDNIILTEKKKIKHSNRRVDIYRVVNKNNDSSKILKYFANNSNDITWVLQLIFENDPAFLNDLSNSEKKAIENSLQEDQNIIKFVTQPFEQLNDMQKEVFNILKIAVKNNEYKNIEYDFDGIEHLANTKCLKILYISNNWYLAVESDDKQFQLLRIAFIKKVMYSKKTTYQKQILDKYKSYFNNLQNAFTQYGVKKQKAILKISPERAKYFHPKMRPFFSSQRFINEDELGFFTISIEYTQPLEILPFIKQWLPHIQIIEPLDLKNELKRELKKSIDLLM